MARAPINAATLRWARELSRVPIEDLAAAAGTSSARIEEFEAGSHSPTFRQLTLIAAKLDRPLGFFFATAPAHSDVPEAADFRGRSLEVPPALLREMRRAEQHRDAILDLTGARESRIELRALTRANIASEASRLRTQLGLTDAFTPPESQQNQVFNFWRGLLEENGIIVFQTSRIPLTAFRGLSIHHDALPLILVNGADSASGKSFTLFHEVAHLANRTSGLCLLDDGVNEEAIANSFSANFLMPEVAVRRFLASAPPGFDAAIQLAAAFKVSVLAAGVRLRNLGQISDEQLAGIRQQSDETWGRVREQQRESSGFVPPWRLRYRDLGNTYIGTIADALREGRVDMTDATYLLNARVPMVEQLLDEYYRTGGAS
ncbi:MAG: ImmA/IrrE family metallo-endopeptidase [Candidatus Nanopelagicales bacterium]|nr:ImmA/IrrE family metallo-endopeptidase [Candidatus Nanopelagicales bacterium]